MKFWICLKTRNICVFANKFLKKLQNLSCIHLLIEFCIWNIVSCINIRLHKNVVFSAVGEIRRLVEIVEQKNMYQILLLPVLSEEDSIFGYRKPITILFQFFFLMMKAASYISKHCPFIQTRQSVARKEILWCKTNHPMLQSKILHAKIFGQVNLRSVYACSFFM